MLSDWIKKKSLDLEHPIKVVYFGGALKQDAAMLFHRADSPNFILHH